MRGRAVEYKDHLGNEFASRAKMCRAWNVPVTTFVHRIEKGMSIEEALTLPARGSNLPKVDPDGVEYASFSEMARAHGFLVSTLRYRLLIGMPLKLALTAPIEHHAERNC